MKPSYSKSLPILAGIAIIAICGFSVYVSTNRALTNLESVLLQIFLLIPSLVGSYYIGNKSATDVAKTIITPHARSAFRRLISIYKCFSRMVALIQSTNNGSHTNVTQTLKTVEAVLIEQLATVDDALEDWRDIVPEEVEELNSQSAKK